MGPTPQQRILSVSELTGQIKELLEGQFPMVWITGEVSNCRRPASGHCYFTLKDAHAQITAVLFRPQLQRMKFSLEDGLHVVGLGRISVYAPRGNYQVIFEYLEPEGRGALQLAFEQLKDKLAAEGLFSPDLKRPLPFLPGHICLVTSPTGAVIHDMIHIIRRRFSGIRISILPVRVQGEGAARDIVDALETVSRLDDVDVVIVARGGGSMEDLVAYNDESVARAIRGCAAPVISAVGHETDYTIADFAADLRAPTPSAAAELAVPVRADLKRRVDAARADIVRAVDSQLSRLRTRVTDLRGRIRDPRRVLTDHRLRLDDLVQRMVRTPQLEIRRHRERLAWRRSRLCAQPFRAITADAKEKLYMNKAKFSVSIHKFIDMNKSVLAANASRLEALSPLSVLDRGYSITRLHPRGPVVRSVKDIDIDQRLDVTVADGTMTTRVIGKPTDE